MKSLNVSSELENKTMDEVYSEVKEVIKSIFPDSFVRQKQSSLGPKSSLCIEFALNKEWNYNIIQNDPGWSHFWIHDVWNKTTGIQENILIIEAPDTFGRIFRNIKWSDKEKAKKSKTAKGLANIKNTFKIVFSQAKENLK